MIFRFYRKLTDFLLRLIDVIRYFPIRLYRIGRHFWRGCLFFSPLNLHWKEPFVGKKKIQTWANWMTELVFYLIDLFGIAEFYEIGIDFVKFNTRPLSKEEIDLAKTLFGDSINYRRVRIDEAAYAGPKQHRFAYVSFYTINSWGKMSPSFFLHELTHVWQYEQMGAVYIPKALRAQFSPEGYNYGGVRQLRNHQIAQKTLHDFNLEQQADIVSDFYRIQDGKNPHWGKGACEDLPIYTYFVDYLKENEPFT